MNQKWPQMAGAVVVACAFALASGNVCLAQSNPLLPAGVGSGADFSGRYGGGGNGRLGRGKGPIPQGGDANPAETLLKNMDGTNYGRYTGHAYFRGQSVRDARRFEGGASRSRRANPRAVYYGNRGDYERSIYAPRTNYRGSNAPAGQQRRARLPNPADYY